ncbi:MAG: hypothetical protein R3Y46_06770 [Opitutales bacterium]
MKIHKFNPIRKKDTLLYKLLLIIAGLHAIALFILGGIIISEIVIEPETTFEAPPPPEKVEKKKTFQHKAKQQQQNSKKPIKRIQIPPAKMNNVSTANIALPSADTAGAGLGGALAPKDLGDMNITMSSVSLLGVSGRTEKVVIVIDTSGYMMTDEKGALNTYNVIKNDIKKLISSLPATILFNVIAFSAPLPNTIIPPTYGRWIGSMKMNAFSNSGMVTASPANKTRLIEWLDPINQSLDDVNKLQSNYKLKWQFLPQIPDAPPRGYSSRGSRYYVPYQAALEQGADTIYILTSQWSDSSDIKKPFPEAVLKAHKDRVAKARAEYDNRINSRTPEEKARLAETRKKQTADRAESNKKALAKAKAEIDAENAKRKKAGTSLLVSTAEQYARKKGWMDTVKISRDVFVEPEAPNAASYSPAEIASYYLGLIKKDKGEGAKLPVLNMIMFRGKTENIAKQSILADRLTKVHKGTVKVLVGTDL